MSKSLSLKLKDDIFEEVEYIIKKIKKHRNTYINEALSLYNQLKRKEIIKNQLELESKLVRENSMKVLKEFEELEDNILE
jgi:predicted transcriptional regulator